MDLTHYLLIAVGGGVLAAVLAIAVVTFMVSFVGWIATLRLPGEDQNRRPLSRS